MYKEHVCLLKKSLYGLKTAAKGWYKTFSKVIEKLGFTMYENQACIFYWRKGRKEGDKVVIILLYVDDMLITGNCKDKIFETKRLIGKEFKIKDLGEPKQFLGIDIKRNKKDKIMELSQSKFIEKILEKFKMKDAKICKTPIRTNQNKKVVKKIKEKAESRLKLRDNMPYRQLVGSLMYLQGST